MPARGAAVCSDGSHAVPLHPVRRALRLHPALLPRARRRGAEAAAPGMAHAAQRGAAQRWVDPRLESHATQDRFGFEWNQRGQHPTVDAWAEAVRDDWTKFMHKVGGVGGVGWWWGCQQAGGQAGRQPWLLACHACQAAHAHSQWARLPPFATRHAACTPMPDTGMGCPSLHLPPPSLPGARGRHN